MNVRFRSFEKDQGKVRDNLNRIVIHGRALKGLRVSGSFMSVPWVKEEFLSKLGFLPYPGTFNVEVTENDSLEKWRAVKESKGIEIVSRQEGFCNSTSYKAVINDEIECAILVPHVSEYEGSKMEILAPWNIRKTLGIEEGHRVKVEVLLYENSKC
jgi:CTP-dependent riboflavin kinase